MSTGWRTWARCGMAIGLTSSLCGNVLDVAHRDGPVAAMVGAAVWPVLLLVTIEVLIRAPWSGRAQGAARLLIVGVAVGSGVISYGHLRDLLIAWGEAPEAAAIGPLVVDAAMLVCALALTGASAPPVSAPASVRVDATVSAPDAPAPAPAPVAVSAPAPAPAPVAAVRAVAAASAPAVRRITAPAPAPDAPAPGARPSGARRDNAELIALARECTPEQTASARALASALHTSQARAGAILRVIREDPQA